MARPRKSGRQPKEVASQLVALPMPASPVAWVNAAFAQLFEAGRRGDRRAADAADVLFSVATILGRDDGDALNALKDLRRAAIAYLQKLSDAPEHPPTPATAVKRAQVIRRLLMKIRATRDRPILGVMGELLIAAAPALVASGLLVNFPRGDPRRLARKISRVRDDHPADDEHVAKALLMALGLSEIAARNMIDAAMSSGH